MRFSHCKNLIRTPDFTGVPYLEELILEGCIRLCEIHSSLLLHKKVILLNLKDCASLRTLPSKIAMESLRELVLSGCSKLRMFPEIVGSMECLSQLLLDGTALKELPLSVELLCGLVLLNLKDCKNLKSFPSAIINGLKCLKTLNISGCSKLENVPENLREVESLEELDISGTAVRQLTSSIFLPKNLKALSVRGCKRPQESTSWFSRFPISLIPRRSSNPMALMLPSLSGLPSLRKLDLSDCNIGEGEIPTDICNLFSLQELVLSKNNFVSLPGTINRLSELKFLELEDCMRLVSLQELPPNIQQIRLDGCASLERVSDVLKSCKSEYFGFSAVKCLKLVGDNDWVFSMLEGFFKVESRKINGLCFVVPVSEIPEWFRYKNEGSSITIIKPPNSYHNRNKLVGYAVCCVFHVHKHLATTARNSGHNRTHQLYCGMKVDKILTCTFHVVDFNEELGQAVSDHLCISYYPCQRLYQFGWNFEANHVELSFRPYVHSGPGLEVKACGVHPVYVDEVEEFNQTTKEWRRSKVWNVYESDYIFDVATASKRSLSECAGAEASDEEPQPKRYKELE
ncbi:TMV resistance protein N-like [Melia azedarach]|uniref:TMV resistance protein N-like n=1 Tax=Melia azedarach TaxID=155640 RepID=A0ACC1X2I0_MELAZ|nr:TMV resistance protein N-like [Melia azedarach]